jgi:competence ComEA-like helix-hairpin-helix protein
MSSDAGYRLDGARAQISVARIRNPRPDTNRSGTLSLELWALPAPFAGGRFQGCHLAGVEIGSVNGQGELALQPIDLALTPPPPGYWQIVLMLREWTAAGFVTRDFANFATRYFSAPVVEEAPAPMPVVEKPSVPIAEKLPVLVVAKPAAPAVAKAPAPEVAKAAVPAQPAKAAADGSATRVSVNTARVEELAVVKGLSTKLAEGIVRKRPFASLDDLRRVKGLGANILAKVRSSLKL